MGVVGGGQLAGVGEDLLEHCLCAGGVRRVRLVGVRLWVAAAEAIDDTIGLPALELLPSYMPKRAGAAQGVLVGFPEGTPAKPEADFRSLLGRYPQLVGWYFGRQGEHAPVLWEQVGTHQPPILRLTWAAPIDLGAFTGDFVADKATSYGIDGRLWVYPTVGSNSLPLHPLVTWWMILFALSMMARYQPEEWVRGLDVNRSKMAVPVESLLDAACHDVPEIASRAFIDFAPNR